MPALPSIYYASLLLLLLISCRSEKVAFQFRPTQPLSARADTTRHADLAAARVTAPKAPQPAMLPFRSIKQSASARSKPTQLYRVITRSAQRALLYKAGTRKMSKGTILLRQPSASRVLEMRKAATLGQVLFLVGSLLIPAGLVIGIIIGGSAGFNVGAIIFAVGFLMAGAAYGGIK